MKQLKPLLLLAVTSLVCVAPAIAGAGRAPKPGSLAEARRLAYFPGRDCAWALKKEAQRKFLQRSWDDAKKLREFAQVLRSATRVSRGWAWHSDTQRVDDYLDILGRDSRKQEMAKLVYLNVVGVKNGECAKIATEIGHCKWGRHIDGLPGC